MRSCWKRFLQTRIAPKISIRSLNDRYNTLIDQLPAANKAIQEEREVNLKCLNSIPEAAAFLKTPSKLMPLKEVLEFIKEAPEMEGIVYLLREQRYLGAPIRKEIEEALLARLAQLDDKSDEILEKLIFPSQLSPLSQESVQSLLKE